MHRLLSATLAAVAVSAALPVLADGDPHPHNDYGVMSEDVVRQRLVQAGHTNIRLTKTPAGYRAITVKNGQPQTLDVDAVRMTIKPSRALLERPIPKPAPTK